MSESDKPKPDFVEIELGAGAQDAPVDVDGQVKQVTMSHTADDAACNSFSPIRRQPIFANIYLNA
jgi:hypothetical protein